MRCQKYGSARELIRLHPRIWTAKPLVRPPHVFYVTGTELFVERRLYCARRDRINLNIPLAELVAQGSLLVAKPRLWLHSRSRSVENHHYQKRMRY